MLKRGDKRGLSEVVTNLLIILLVLVAVGVIWVVVANIISQGAGDIEIGQFTYDISIESAYISGSDVVVGVRRSVGGGPDFTGVNFIFTNNEESVVIKKTGFIEESGRRTFTFVAAEIPGIGAGDEVSVAPTYITSGTEKVANPTDAQTISGTPPPGGGEPPGGAVCGNGIKEGTEQCDDGGTASGDGCSASCQTEIPSSCNNNNQIDSGEFCDGTNLNSQTCQTQGFVGGVLSCNNCGFDTSQCTTVPGGETPECDDNLDNDGDGNADLSDVGCADSNDNDETNCGDSICEGGETTSICPVDCVPPIPPSCDGTWNPPEDVGVECDGTPLPNGCSVICICDPGFTENGVGGCALNPPLNTGTIFTIWHNIYFDSNDLQKNITVTDYINEYVNFSGSQEVGCFLITFADYLPDDDMSYLRVDDSQGAPEIVAGQGYSIWEAVNCGQ